jgi:hypothetical protein
MEADATSSTLGWEEIEGVLPEGWRELAIEMKLIRPNLPEHMGTKVKEIGPVLRLVLYKAARNAALVNVTAAFAAAGSVSMSAVGLHKWYKKIGDYLAELVRRMVEKSHAGFAPERWAGLEIVVVDATCIQRPGAKGTTSRVHRALRLTDLRVVEVHATDDTGGESFRRFQPEPGQLWMGDRCYANPPGIAWVQECGAKVLVRYNRGSLPVYDDAGHALDVQAKLQALDSTGRCCEWQAFVHQHDGLPIEGRLCAVRLPPDKAQKARERLRREDGPQVTRLSLQMAEFVVVFTTLAISALSCEQILELYRARWQIELDFKRDKSITGMDNLPNFLPETIRTWIYAKLLLQQIVISLSTPPASFPPCTIVHAIGPTSTASTS